MTLESLPNQSIDRPDASEGKQILGEYRLLDDPQEILETWGGEIEKAEEGDKVWLRTMHLRDGEAMRFLAPLLISAKKRGADVKLVFDPISYLESNGLPSYVRHFPVPGRTEIADEYERNTALIRQLRKADIQLDPSSSNSLGRQLVPYKGADHIKGARIRNRFWFGDKNLERVSFSQMKGFVVEIPDPEIIAIMTAIIGSAQGTREDTTYDELSTDPDTKIIWDAGIAGKSTIYKTALDMVGRANRFVGTATQFYPEGRYFQKLKDATARGARVESITSSPDFFGISPYAFVNDLSGKLIRWDGVMPNTDQKDDFNPDQLGQTSLIKFLLANRALLLEAFKREAASGFKGRDRSGDFSMAFVEEGVHAKYLVTESEDEKTGEVTEEVYFGTNNLSEWGTGAGTAELGIYSRNPQIVRPVRAYHDRLLQSSLEAMTARRASRKANQ